MRKEKRMNIDVIMIIIESIAIAVMLFFIVKLTKQKRHAEQVKSQHFHAADEEKLKNKLANEKRGKHV